MVGAMYKNGSNSSTDHPIWMAMPCNLRSIFTLILLVSFQCVKSNVLEHSPKRTEIVPLSKYSPHCTYSLYLSLLCTESFTLSLPNYLIQCPMSPFSFWPSSFSEISVHQRCYWRATPRGRATCRPRHRRTEYWAVWFAPCHDHVCRVWFVLCPGTTYEQCCRFLLHWVLHAILLVFNVAIFNFKKNKHFFYFCFETIWNLYRCRLFRRVWGYELASS